MNESGYVSLEELRTGVRDGIWLLTGGNIKLQRFIKASIKSKEDQQQDLKKVRSAIKLKQISDMIQYIIIHSDGMFDTRDYPKNYIVATEQDDGSLLLMLEKVEVAYYESVEDSVRKVIASGAITREEYDKYSNKEIWDTLPRIEFTIVRGVANE